MTDVTASTAPAIMTPNRLKRLIPKIGRKKIDIHIAALAAAIR